MLKFHLKTQSYDNALICLRLTLLYPDVPVESYDHVRYLSAPSVDE